LNPDAGVFTFPMQVLGVFTPDAGVSTSILDHSPDAGVFTSILDPLFNSDQSLKFSIYVHRFSLNDGNNKKL
jgi:hypothetical protein